MEYIPSNNCPCGAVEIVTGNTNTCVHAMRYACTHTPHVYMYAYLYDNVCTPAAGMRPWTRNEPLFQHSSISHNAVRNRASQQYFTAFPTGAQASCTIDSQRASTAAAVRRKFGILPNILFLSSCGLKITSRYQHRLKYM